MIDSSQPEILPRRIRVAYYNAVHEGVLNADGWLTKYDPFETHHGRKAFWNNS